MTKPYPAPLEIPALPGPHTHASIILHGRGSNAERFGRELLSSASLATRLPTVKFVFPTARRRRATVFKKMPIYQWFDNYSLCDPGYRTELQIDGLAEIAQFLRTLIDRKARLLGDGDEGYKRILLGGLSQGCAAGAFALLGGLASGSRLGAFVGMSGWLPFQAQLEEILCIKKTFSLLGADDTVRDTDGAQKSGTDSDTNSEDDSNESDTSGDDGATEEEGTSVSDIEIPLDSLSLGQAEEEDFDPFRPQSDDAQPIPYLETPVFLGHGAADPKVSIEFGENMAMTLIVRFNMDVTWRSYEGFGHWHKVPDEIDDMMEFLRNKTSVLVETVENEGKTAEDIIPSSQDVSHIVAC